MAEKREILRNVNKTILNARRCLENQDVDSVNILKDLRTAQRSIDVIKNVISNDNYGCLSSTITALADEIEMKRSDQTDNAFSAPREVVNGRRGRPEVIISENQLRLFHNLNYTVPQMAKHFSCSSSTVYQRMYSMGLHQRDKFCSLTDQELDAKVQQKQTHFPNAGSVMMNGLLRSNGTVVQRQKLRKSIERVSPIPVVQRLAKTVARRKYAVQMSNSLWHIDGHMKLIRWGISTHGGIDGYSRLITFLKASTNNRAKTVLEKFVNACNTYGVPSRVRSDKGGENIMVALFLNLVNGEDRHSHITGRSVHNQRIERLWRDVFTQVIEKYYCEFYALEDRGDLDPEDAQHLFSLHLVYLPVINKQLECFRNAWNKHQISTENNMSPEQLWLNGLLNNINSSTTVCRSIYGSNDVAQTLEQRIRGYGLDPAQFEEEEDGPNIISSKQMEYLCRAIADLENPVLQYKKCLEFLTQLSHVN